MSFIGGSVYQQGLINTVDTRITAAEAAILANKATYDTKVAAIDTKNDQQDGRLTVVEGKVTALETDLSGRVQTEINDKVAQATFDALAAELRTADSALSTVLATKVAETVQLQTDDAQNTLINSKVSQVDYDLYVEQAATDLQGVNDSLIALIATAQNTADDKVAQTEYDAYVVSNDAAVLALQQGKVDNSTYNSAISGLESSITTINSTLSTHTTDIATAQQTADSKVSQVDYDINKSGLEASIATKVAQTEYDNHVTLINSAVASKVAQTDYDTYVSNNNAVIALKATDSEFQSYKNSNDYAVSLKANQSTLASYISSNDALVASKVSQMAYDNRQGYLDYLDKSWENRFYAVEEFVRAFLKTYNITKTDNTLYDYTGLSQNLDVPPPPFKLVGKKAIGDQSWLLCVQFTEYGYNTLMGDIVFELQNGQIIQGFSRQDINGNTKYIDVPIGGARMLDTNNWNTSVVPLPLNIRQRNTKAESLCQVVITQAIIDALPLLNSFSPEKPTNLAYNAVTKSLTFDVPNPNLIDFLDININDSVWYQIQDTSNLFKFEGTHVTVNLNLAPVTPTTSIRVYTRYDKITGTANGETEIISIGSTPAPAPAPAPAPVDSTRYTLELTGRTLNFYATLPAADTIRTWDSAGWNPAFEITPSMVGQKTLVYTKSFVYSSQHFNASNFLLYTNNATTETTFISIPELVKVYRDGVLLDDSVWLAPNYNFISSTSPSA